jgi:hypothetical protein
VAVEDMSLPSLVPVTLAHISMAQRKGGEEKVRGGEQRRLKVDGGLEADPRLSVSV